MDPNDINDPELVAPGESSASGGPVTITLRPHHVAIAALGVVAFAAGVWLSRSRLVANAGAAPQASAQGPVVVSVGGANSPAVRARSGSEIAPGQVLDLRPDSPMLGQAYIDIEGTMMDGNRGAVADFIGRPVMLNFWATWCPPCRIEMPWMEEIYQEFKDEGFVIVAVDAGERVPASQVVATVTSFVERTGLSFPVLLPDDPYSPQLEYSVYGLPSTYMINTKGNVVDSHRGMYPNRATLRDRVTALIASEAG